MTLQPLLGRALKSALECRIRNDIALDTPCDVYDLIARQGLELRFMEIKSLEGLYLADGAAGQINVCAYRPAGLQRFAAAHELGHHVFGHGSSIDLESDYKERFSTFSREERVADMFARFLLMPARAVRKGFANIGADSTQPTAPDVFRVASWLGVGYTTLLHQMRWSLQLLDQAKFDALLKVRPQQIKQQLTPCIQKYGRTELWTAHTSWNGSRIHAQVGDIITGLGQKTSTLVTTLDNCTFQAVSVGEAVVPLEAGLVTLSVCKKEFVGFYEYRYLAEAEDAGN